MSLPVRYSYEHLKARRGRSAATAVIIATVVLATALFSGLVSSIKRTLVSTGSERNLIVLRKGASDDGSSFVTLEDYRRPAELRATRWISRERARARGRDHRARSARRGRGHGRADAPAVRR
jgi:hypothetical protein